MFSIALFGLFSGPYGVCGAMHAHDAFDRKCQWPVLELAG
jgi:hypothetical protein